ncbi:CSN8-PSD8-EIF3K domain-containing protein [Mycena sanguinolenta]|uniref:CSN8-PSD8-EIF3K domain-containing protein n=1 Tax=Mycena sanguinolenta TaxID=230812 RepID=A0A8H6YPK8_9AGAR|nr:CSN8-PSD8-EIF3K domain-containing protein [Mycena sanguinolenta]
MSTAGPPTPPPSSATEIQDATRTIVPPVPAASTSAPAPARQDNFTQIFPEIVSLAAEKRYVELIDLAEFRDVASDADRQPSRLLLTAPLVLAYLTIDDLPPARFALNRLPHNLATSPLGKQLHLLLASTSERKYANVYSRTQALLEHVRQSDFFDPSLGALLGDMISAFLEAFRFRTFSLLQKAYTSLSLSLAEMYLGLAANDVLTAAERTGWSYDASTQVLTPPQKSNVRTTNGFAPFSSLATFDFVANSVAKLET